TMSNPRPETVAAALDVHKDSIRLAAVREEELLDERTLPCDHVAVERALARWPGVRVCYEAGPTGFGLHRQLAERGIRCEVIAPGTGPDKARRARRDRSPRRPQAGAPARSRPARGDRGPLTRARSGQGSGPLPRAGAARPRARAPPHLEVHAPQR